MCNCKDNTSASPATVGSDCPIPAHPIVIPPGSIAPGVPAHPIVLPPPIPAHPIEIPPGNFNPRPEHPIVLPPFIPTHPIVIPPDAVSPGVPAHPIVIPPTPVVPPPTDSLPILEEKPDGAFTMMWQPGVGYILVKID